LLHDFSPVNLLVAERVSTMAGRAASHILSFSNVLLRGATRGRDSGAHGRILKDRISRVEPLNRRQRSAAVPGCEWRRRLAASSTSGRDARPTRRRDADATRFI
jgi:hypothetical protein